MQQLWVTPLIKYEGLTKDQAYCVFAVTGSTVVVLNDKQRLTQIPCSVVTTPKEWSFEAVKE